GHRLQKPLVFRLHGDASKPIEVAPCLGLSPVSKARQIQLDQIPHARPELGGQIPFVPRIAPHHLDQGIRVEEEARRVYQPRRSSSFSFGGSTTHSVDEPQASSMPAWSISSATSSAVLSRSC